MISSLIGKLFAASALALAVVSCGPITERFDFEENRAAPELVSVKSPRWDSGKTLERIAFGSCAGQEQDQSIWNTVRAASPQAFLFMGDNVYGDVTSPDMRELVDAYNTLADSRPFAQFAKDVPILAVWDDHDFGRNDAGAEFEYRERSEAIFLDFWNVGQDDERRQREGIYQSFMAGPEQSRVQIIMLDTRSFRSPLKKTDERNAPGKERYLPDPDPGKTMLGEAQWRWLETELQKPAKVRLLVSSIQVIADGHGWERWGNLPLERQRLYDTIKRSGAKGVVLLSGDRHLSAMYAYDTDMPYPLYEITASSLNRPIGDRARGEAGPYRLQEVFTEANFGTLDIDWETGVLSFQINDQGGKTEQRLDLRLEELNG